MKSGCWREEDEAEVGPVPERALVVAADILDPVAGGEKVLE